MWQTKVSWIILCIYGVGMLLLVMHLFGSNYHIKNNSRIVTPIHWKTSTESQTKMLVTLFTTLKNATIVDPVLREVVINWASLGRYIQPCFFYLPDQDPVVQFARGHGWDVLPVPKANKFNVPYLKDMYIKAMQNSDSVFYGYANADILFNPGLEGTLQFLEPHVEKLNPVLVIGRRTTVLYSDKMKFEHTDIDKIAKQGLLDRADAEDYFLTSKKFPWEAMPDLVVGRKGYDNYLVARSVESNFSVIDATKTITALHFKKPADYSGRSIGDHLFNKWKLVNKFDYSKAMTVSAPYYTMFTESKGLKLKQRDTK